jgi:predicted nicotinamide N-methyase
MFELDKILQEVLPGGKTEKADIPFCPGIKLYLLDPSGMDRTFSFKETQDILKDTPFWAFCWASGLALASYILRNPQKVSGRRVVDFGSGSGIVAIAAAIAGAREAVACDIDPNALKAAKYNAELNHICISLCDSLNVCSVKYDLLTAADVLYNTKNLFMLDKFPEYAHEVLLADSRIQDIDHSSYTRICGLSASTLPVLDKDNADEQVSIYEGSGFA